MSETPTGRTRIFISYSHKDQEYLKELQEHLSALERRGLLEMWVDTRLEAGDLWQEVSALAGVGQNTEVHPSVTSREVTTDHS